MNWLHKRRLRELDSFRAQVSATESKPPEDIKRLATRGVTLAGWYLRHFDGRGIAVFRLDLSRILLQAGYYSEVLTLLKDIKEAEKNPNPVGIERELALVKQTAIDRLSGSTVHGFRYPQEEDFPEV